MEVFAFTKWAIDNKGKYVVDLYRSYQAVIGCYLDLEGCAIVVVLIFIVRGAIKKYKVVHEFVTFQNEETIFTPKHILDKIRKLCKYDYILANKDAECLKGDIKTSIYKGVIYEGWETVKLDLDRAYIKLNREILPNNLLDVDGESYIFWYPELEKYPSREKLEDIWYSEFDRYDHTEAKNGKIYHRIFALYNVIDNCTATTNHMFDYPLRGY